MGKLPPRTGTGSVGDAIGAFYGDLKAHGLSDRVLILTISEFGRTPFENADRGSDHGYGSVAFAVGDSLHGGIYGDYPHLVGEATEVPRRSPGRGPPY